MGEAKRRREHIARQPCRCFSGRPAGACCFDGKRWRRAPAVIDLVNTGHKAALARCYLSCTCGCSGKVSNEHLISRAVLLVLSKNQRAMRASGLPWMPEGLQNITVDTVVGNCLCTAHNSALSKLDTNAARFFRALAECESRHPDGDRRYTFSGHDLERWLSKTAAGLAASRLLGTSAAPRLPGHFASGVDIPALLQSIRAWPATSGLYYTQNVGQKMQKHPHFWLEPIPDATGAIAGVSVSIQGLEFVLSPIPVKATAVHYRPGGFIFKMAGFTNTIDLSWEDDAKHAHIIFSGD